MPKFEEPLVVDETLIRTAYRLMLHREPDSPEAVTRAAAYFKTPEQVEATLRDSEEWRVKQVQNFLQASSQKVVRFQSKRGFAMMLDLMDTSVSGQIWFDDDFEPHVEAMLHSHVDWADAFVDVGANVGWFTMIVAHKMRTHGTPGIVHAVEPNPRLAGILSASVVGASLTERVTVHGVAASDRLAVVDLWVPGPHHGASAKILHERWESRARAREEGADRSGGAAGWSAEDQIGLYERVTRAPAMPLDDLLERRHRRIGTIKIDAEGHEPAVIAGARAILEQDRPKLILEINPLALNLSSGMGLDGLMARLDAAGYVIRDPDNREVMLDAAGLGARLGPQGYNDFVAEPRG